MYSLEIQNLLNAKSITSNTKSQDLSSSDDGLTRIALDRFRILEVKEDIDLKSFVEEQYKLKYTARKIFFEFTTREEEIGDDKEVVLMNKVDILDPQLSTIQ